MEILLIKCGIILLVGGAVCYIARLIWDSINEDDEPPHDLGPGNLG